MSKIEMPNVVNAVMRLEFRFGEDEFGQTHNTSIVDQKIYFLVLYFIYKMPYT